MDINNLSIGHDEQLHYDPEFRSVLETFITALRNSPKATIMPVDPASAYRYEYNFTGLLLEMNVPHQYRWITMRVNGFDTHMQSTKDLRHVLIPDFTLIENIRSMFVTKLE